MQEPFSGAPASYSSPALASSPAFHGPGTGGLDWRQLWQTLLEKGWVVILLTLTGLFLAWGYLARSPKLYQSHLTLEVQSQEATLVDTGGGTAGGPRPGGSGMFGLAGQEALHTIEQKLRTRALLVRVLKSENLTGAEGARALLSTPKVPYTGGALPEETMANVFAGMTNATIRRGTRFIDVFVTHADPTLARRLADALGREFIRSNIEGKQDFYQQSTRILLQEAERLKLNLQKSERAVAEYKANTPNALSLGGSDTSVSGGGNGGGGRSSASARLEELSSKLSATKSDRMRLENDMVQIEAAAIRGGAAELLKFPIIANSPTISERRRELAGIQGAVAQLSQRYKDKHPKMINARVALDGAQAALNQAVLAEPALLRSALAQAKANEESLATATKDSEKAALDLNQANIGYQELARQADTDRVLYENIIGQIKRTGLAMEANRSDAVSIVEAASQPGGPVSPQPNKAIAAGVLGGLLSGLGLVGLLAALDRTVKTVEQAEGVFGLPVLAAVPEVEGKERRRQKKESRAATPNAPAGETAVTAASAPEGPVAEAFRSLRAALALLGPEDERRVVLMTSALPGEGKSFTSANLAMALAQQGQRVLLIDADLRRPTQGRLFFGGSDGDNGGDHGVIDYLLAGSPGGNGTSAARSGYTAAKAVDLMATVRSVALPGSNGTSGYGGMWLLPAGRRAPNPAELLGSSAGQAGVARMVSDALQHFDRVIIDSAPLLAVSDTLLLLPHTQTVLVVVHARKTARAALARGLTLLAQAAAGAGARAAALHPGAPTPAAAAGLILNRLPRRRGLGYYYYYGQEYSYGQLETRESTRRQTTPAASAGHGNGNGQLTGRR